MSLFRRPRPASALATAALTLALAGAERPASAHPHVWVTDVTTFLFAGPELVGLRHHWRFDELFSSYVIGEHDADAMGRSTPPSSPRSSRTRSRTSPSTAISAMRGSTAPICR